MKRFIYFVAILFWAGVPRSSFASNDDIDVRRNHGTYINTRSVENLPEASIENRILTVSFDNYGVYALSIENNYGVIVYVSILPADGKEYQYDLYNLCEDSFNLIIEGYGGEYQGSFKLL